MQRLPVLLLVALVLLGARAAVAQSAFTVGDPSWSPDGRQLAFDGSVDGANPDVYAVQIDGSHLVNLTAGDPERNVLPSWGRRLQDVGYETDLSDAQTGRVRYSVVAPDGTDRRDVTGSTAIGPIWWSYGDRYIAYDGRLDAEVARVGSDSRRAAVADAISGPWAPRALRTTFAIAPGVSNSTHLYTMSATARARRQLTRGHESVQPLGWSRNGRWILFDRNDGPGSFDLYTVRASGGPLHLLASGARAADFSPASTRVVYADPDGGIATIGVDGTGRRVLTTDGGDPKWSPAGAWIAFVADGQIELIRPNGSDRHTLVGS